jgi:hypothetical protein
VIFEWHDNRSITGSIIVWLSYIYYYTSVCTVYVQYNSVGAQSVIGRGPGPRVSRLNPHVRQSAFSPSLPSPPPQPQPQHHHLNSFNFTTPAPPPSSSTTPNASDESLPRDAIVAVLSLPPWRSRPAPPRLWLDRPRASASDNKTECLRDAALPTPAAHWQPRETWETCQAGGPRSRLR